ncbi:hypothetical protein CKO44_23300 [Rubrivivax gelatinosus]|uniref:DUF2255 family protein n=1 Tax=Rubrivivax gelatinosus TaxID=28068 RepID=A0ABS1E2B7_RUBGE|nr:DUF2255 family protein [Rubrivivax gelatinosus]MBK1616375.1 hypothetical protein [Rubrivivax gelatinosus]MBK1715729.1 hypothetical protein [Rubrivivax gelatinosus]MBZ8143114.1 hypothetical protein [Rubrivivax gelatinosus]
MFHTDFVATVNRAGLVGVSAGKDRATPLEIWVVAVGNRLFARSWGLSERSWYSTFLSGAHGFLECEGQRVQVSGREPLDLQTISPLIDAEYLRKYDRGENSKYARGILGQQHIQRTLEFIPLVG